MATQPDGSLTRVIPAFKARQNFGQLLEAARYRGQRFVVERSGRPMAVVIGIEEWENIIETLAELDDPDYLESIKEARREIQLGESITLEELRKDLAKSGNVL
jgi:prevent-host-death family protein